MSKFPLSLPASTQGYYRLSVSSFFFIQGLVFSSWASRIPDIKQMLSMSDAQLGSVLFVLPVGQLCAMALSGWLVNKYGSRKILLAAALLYPFSLIFLGLISSIWQLSMALFFFGIASNLTNISVNTQAVGVERLYGRSIMASFHGLWSLAGFAGGVISTWMVGHHIAPYQHFILIFFVTTAILISMRGSMLPRDGKKAVVPEKKKPFVKPDLYIILLGLIAFGSMSCEGTMFDWSGVYFQQVIQPDPRYIRLGYVACMLAMTIGRFFADKLVTRLGAVNVLKISGLVIVTGLLTGVLFPHLLSATIGFFLVGLGVSSVVPLCYSLAGKSPRIPTGMAVAMVSSIGFLGFLSAPPLIGFIAQISSLRWSFCAMAVIGLMTTFLAPKLHRK